MIDYTLPLDQLPDPLPIEPLRKPFDVTITPPGSKSITCRAYVLAALAKGESKIIRPLRADDTDLLLEALCTLGAEARWVPGADGEDVFIKGVNGRFPRGGRVYLGDGGTPTRFMIACACLAAEPVVVDASPRMRERPIAEGIEMLRQLGAKIEYVEEEGRLPVRVVPNGVLLGGETEVGRTQSSQSISAVMLIAPFTARGITVRFVEQPTSISYIRLTKETLESWGVECNENWWWPESGGMQGLIKVVARPISSCQFVVEPDASSALYWFLAASVSEESAAKINDLGWDQPDMRILGWLRGMGPTFVETSGLNGTSLRVIGTGEFNGEDIAGDDCPDGSVALAVVSCAARNASKITGLRTLRVKETDRIAALANELRRVGCTVETGEDWISIEPPPPPDVRAGAKHSPAEPGTKGEVIIETYNDHRMAMAFAVLGLVRPGISIRNPACVKKSYPGFWRDFAKLYQ